MVGEPLRERRVVPEHRPLEARLGERAVKEQQTPLFRDLPGDSTLPPLALLDEAPPVQETVAVDVLEFTSRLIEKKLSDFGVEAAVVAAYPGPVVTRYEIEPATGVKGSQIVNLARDLAEKSASGDDLARCFDTSIGHFHHRSPHARVPCRRRGG